MNAEEGPMEFELDDELVEERLRVIPGALERVVEGIEQARAGNVIPFEQPESFEVTQ